MIMTRLVDYPSKLRADSPSQAARDAQAPSKSRRNRCVDSATVPTAAPKAAQYAFDSGHALHHAWDSQEAVRPSSSQPRGVARAGPASWDALGGAPGA